jgi:hypothetical protein
MGKPPSKPSEGGHIGVLRELEGIAQGEFQQGSGTSALLALKVRPEAFPNGSPIPVGKMVCTFRYTHQSVR